MDQKTFEKQVEQELKKLSKEQIIHFAWLCAVRALPFLGSKGNFSFWDKEYLQKHLYSIFYALDVNASIHASIAAQAAYEAAKAYIDISVSSVLVSASAQAAYAVSAAAEAAVSASCIHASSAAQAAHSASRSASYCLKIDIDLKSTILLDLETIQNPETGRYINLTAFYGSVWTNFQKALETEGFAYWGRLYQSIFDNGFVLNKEALKRRMSVPPEIRSIGASTVADYLEALEKGAEHLNEARILILGDKGAGKTCLSRRMVNPNAPMTTDDESTPGVDTTLWKLKEENINVHIWDFAGHTVTHAVHQLFLSERCLYVIVYDGRTEERNRLEYWLNHMKNYGGDSQAIIIVNTRDQHRVNIPINSLKEQYPIHSVHSFSIKDDKEKLANFCKEVAGFIQNNPSWSNQLIPANYYRVKDNLEELFITGDKGKCKEHISIEEFDVIAKKNETENYEDLLTNLHALGISLWYKDMADYNTLVLNPEWISYGIYKIINWANEAKKYTLAIYDFAKVFKEESIRYPEDKFKFLFELIKRYELAYEFKDGNTLIIPHLLKEDRPVKLPDFPVGESLMLRYKAEQPLPPNTISRFIIRHNEQIKKQGNLYLVWRKGVILQDTNGTIALVREEDRTISVSVKGKDKTNYISVLRETLNDIFNSYKSKKPELQYRIEQFGEIPDGELEIKDPIWLLDRKILAHALDNVPYYDENTRQQIYLNYTVNNYQITTQTLMSGNGSQFFDNSIHNTFNFHDCNIGLQENLNDLARVLTKTGNIEEAEELKEAATLLEEVENCKTKEEVRKKGIARSLQQLAEKLGDEDSKLHKTVEGIRSGIGIAQDIAKGYNDVAQWLGLPQVPKPFLKKHDNN